MTNGIKIANDIMIVLLILLSVPMLLLTFRVCNIVWHSDKVIPLMLITLYCSILMWIIYFIFVNVSENNLVWQNN